MIAVKIDVDDRALKVRLDQLPSRLQSKLRVTIAQLTNEMLGRVRAAEPMRTGQLRSQTQAFVDVRDDMVRGRVRILGTGRQRNIAAAALEYGAHRLVNVRAHAERLHTVFGVAIAERSVAIPAYTRRANIRAERFLRNPAEDMREEAIRRIEQTINETVRQ